MHLARYGSIVFLLSAMTLLCAQTSPMIYPEARRSDQVDDYHGTKVADPYRWLEDTDSAETHAWVEAENKLTFGYLEQIPHRQAIHERLTKLWNYERFTASRAAKAAAISSSTTTACRIRTCCWSPIR